jgi:hypothetical protein
MVKNRTPHKAATRATHNVLSPHRWPSGERECLSTATVEQTPAWAHWVMRQYDELMIERIDISSDELLGFIFPSDEDRKSTLASRVIHNVLRATHNVFPTQMPFWKAGTSFKCYCEKVFRVSTPGRWWGNSMSWWERGLIYVQNREMYVMMCNHMLSYDEREKMLSGTWTANFQWSSARTTTSETTTRTS